MLDSVAYLTVTCSSIVSVSDSCSQQSVSMMAGAIFLIAIDCKVWRFEDHCAHRPAGISGRTQSDLLHQ